MSQMNARLRDGEVGGFGNTGLLDAADVADLAGLKTDYVYSLARKGEIPAVKIGRYVRFRRDSIEKWFDELEYAGAGR